MARPKKDGFDYFPFDVNLDDDFKALESVFKNDGFVWMVKFWQSAYKTNSGNVNLSGAYEVIHVENSRVTLEKHREILKFCLEIGLVRKVSDGIYTSDGVQNRIKFVLDERKRYRNGKKSGKKGFSTEKTPEKPHKEKEIPNKGIGVSTNPNTEPVATVEEATEIISELIDKFRGKTDNG